MAFEVKPNCVYESRPTAGRLGEARPAPSDHPLLCLLDDQWPKRILWAGQCSEGAQLILQPANAHDPVWLVARRCDAGVVTMEHVYRLPKIRFAAADEAIIIGQNVSIPDRSVTPEEELSVG